MPKKLEFIPLLKSTVIYSLLYYVFSFFYGLINSPLLGSNRRDHFPFATSICSNPVPTMNIVSECRCLYGGIAFSGLFFLIGFFLIVKKVFKEGKEVKAFMVSLKIVSILYFLGVILNMLFPKFGIFMELLPDLPVANTMLINRRFAEIQKQTPFEIYVPNRDTLDSHTIDSKRFSYDANKVTYIINFGDNPDADKIEVQQTWDLRTQEATIQSLRGSISFIEEYIDTCLKENIQDCTEYANQYRHVIIEEFTTEGLSVLYINSPDEREYIFSKKGDTYITLANNKLKTVRKDKMLDVLTSLQLFSQ